MKKIILAAASILIVGLISVLTLSPKGDTTPPKGHDPSPIVSPSATPEPTAEPTSTPTFIPTPEPVVEPEPVVLAFAGDVLTGERIGPKIKAGLYDEVLDPDTAELMKSADFAIINYESSVSNRGRPVPDKEFTFRSPPEHLAFLRDYLGVDAASLANNHTLDFGWDAFSDTLSFLTAFEITPIGAGEDINQAAAPFIAETDDVKIAIFAANQILPAVSWRAGEDSPGQLVTKNPDNLEQLAEGILEIRDSVDYVIVYMHWGTEKDRKPHNVQKKTAHNLIDMGADIVIGSHPHVIQTFEYYNGKPIVYSLGNFIFNARNPETALLLITLDQGEVTLKAVPCKMSGTLTYPVEGEEAAALFEKWNDLSVDCSFNEDGILVADKLEVSETD